MARTTARKHIEEEPDETKKVDVIKEKVEIKIPSEIELPTIVSTEVVDDHVETINDNPQQTAEGITDGISDSPLVGTAIFNNIGGGGGGSGSFGERLGGGKKIPSGSFGKPSLVPKMPISSSILS